MIDPRPCWHCTQFLGLIYQGTAAACQQGGGFHFRAMPENGCAFWQREVGADDEPDQRPAVDSIVPADHHTPSIAGARSTSVRVGPPESPSARGANGLGGRRYQALQTSIRSSN